MPTRPSYDRVHLSPADVSGVSRILDAYGRTSKGIERALSDISRFDNQVSVAAVTLLRWHLVRAYTREQKAQAAEWRPLR
jgi:hypothetical protein